MFAPYGTVESASLVTDRDTGRSRGFGFVEMTDDSEAASAISGLNGKDSGGRPLTVNVGDFSPITNKIVALPLPGTRSPLNSRRLRQS